MCFRQSLRPGYWLLIGSLVSALASSRPVLAGETKTEGQDFDVLIRGRSIYDGSGNPPRRADVGIKVDRIAVVGDPPKATAKIVVDANDLAVAPGLINMLSWSTDSLLVDGRGQSEIRQGVTTQIMGEGNSWGPVNAAIKKRMKAARPISSTTSNGPLSATTCISSSEKGFPRTSPRFSGRPPSANMFSA